MNDDGTIFGIFLGGILTATLAFCESDSANIHEYEYGKYVCEKNSGFQYFEKRFLSTYEYHCKDKAVFSATDGDIRLKVGAWGDREQEKTE